MVVVVMPEGTAKDASMLQPLVLTASAAELDAGFVEQLATYTGAHASLAEQVAATTAILGDAEKTQVSKATKALRQGGRSPAAANSSQTTTRRMTTVTSDSDDRPPGRGQRTLRRRQRRSAALTSRRFLEEAP